MKDYRINLNYAKALIMLANDLKQEDEVLADMRLVEDVCKENHELCTVLSNPTIKEDKKVMILDEVFKAHVTPTTLAFLKFVTHKRRSINMKGIANEYINLYREEHDIVYTKVVTAVEVHQEYLDNIAKDVEEFTGKKVELDSVTTNKMLGSFYLTFNNYLYDARIRTKIAKLKVEFSKNSYESKL